MCKVNGKKLIFICSKTNCTSVQFLIEQMAKIIYGINENPSQFVAYLLNLLQIIFS